MKNNEDIKEAGRSRKDIVRSDNKVNLIKFGESLKFIFETAMRGQDLPLASAVRTVK